MLARLPAPMLGSFRIGTVFGITVRVHWLFLAMLVFFTLRGPAEMWWWFPMLCAIVFLHELGHSLVAQAFGIRVIDITFWPLGGMARMSEIPEDTRKESLIAVAGPGVNFVLAGLAAPLWAFADRWALAPVWSDALQLFVLMNLGLGIFNLVPAFPMDGGRILRALLGARGDWLRATEQAVHVGRLVALLMGIVGFFTGNFVLPLIALWLWFVGGQELRAVRLRHAPDPLAGLREFVRRAAGAAPHGTWAAGAFGGAPLPGEPALERAPDPTREPNPGAKAEADQRANRSRAPSARGFDEDEIERLERFHGPLRNYRRDEDE